MVRCVCKLAKSRCPYFHQLLIVHLLACDYICTSVASSLCSPGKGTRAACPVFSNFQRNLRKVRTVHWQTWTMQMTTQPLSIAEKNFVSVLYDQRWLENLSRNFLNRSEKNRWCFQEISQQLPKAGFQHPEHRYAHQKLRNLMTCPNAKLPKLLTLHELVRRFSVRLSLAKQISGRKWCVTAFRMVMTAFPPKGSDLWKAWLRCMLMPGAFCSVRRGPVTDAE